MSDRMEEFKSECIAEGDAKRIDGVSKSREAESNGHVAGFQLN